MIAEGAPAGQNHRALDKVLVDLALISWNRALETFRLARKPPGVLLAAALRRRHIGAKAACPLRRGLPSGLDIPTALPAQDERACPPRKAGTSSVRVAVIRPLQS